MITQLNIGPLLSIWSVFFIIVSITSAQSPCKTPDNWNGNCIALQQCRPLYKLYYLRRDLPTEQRTFLRNSQCGRDGDSVLVCCPKTFTIDDLPSTEYCGKQVGNKIVGGPGTTIFESPWMALLHYKKLAGGARGYFCAGALIHYNYVITAAHCIRGPGVVQAGLVVDFVRLGEHDFQSNPDCQQQNQCADPVEDIPIAEFIIHDSYIPASRSQENDIALIRLERSVPYTDFILPICLPVGKLQNRNYDGYPMILSGFGQTEANVSQKAVKVKAGVHGLNLNECAENYHTYTVNLTNGKQLCAGFEDSNGACGGDSGGPLVAEERTDEFSYLVGIDSLGPKDCDAASDIHPEVYTRVDQYIDWILDHMKK